jgi:hypothetical protein
MHIFTVYVEDLPGVLNQSPAVPSAQLQYHLARGGTQRDARRLADDDVVQTDDGGRSGLQRISIS